MGFVFTYWSQKVIEETDKKVITILKIKQCNITIYGQQKNPSGNQKILKIIMMEMQYTKS